MIFRVFPRKASSSQGYGKNRETSNELMLYVRCFRSTTNDEKGFECTVLCIREINREIMYMINKNDKKFIKINCRNLMSTENTISTLQEFIKYGNAN